jgi:hypothetical protein
MESVPPCALSHILLFLSTKELFRSLLRASKATLAAGIEALTRFDAGTTGKPAAVGEAMLRTFDRFCPDELFGR